MSIRDSMMAALQLRMQQQQQQDQAALANAARQQIPGLTGPVSGGAGIPGVGMAPPQQPLPQPMPQPFMASGPYGQQAMQLAGLLGAGNHMMNPPGNIQTQQAGLLGRPPKGLRVPFYRPTGK